MKKKYVFILEVSSYQLQYSKLFCSKHAAILNISHDHLERHRNIKNYIKIKSRIFLAQNRSDYSYINLTNRYSKSIINILKTKKLKSSNSLRNFFLFNRCPRAPPTTFNNLFVGEHCLINRVPIYHGLFLVN